MDMLPYFKMMSGIHDFQELFKDEKPKIIVFDGMAGAGKSYLAEQISRRTAIQLIYMDDFFLPPEKRTAERFEEAGGNIDYERFKEEVVDKLGTDFSYRIFDCSIMDFNGERFISKDMTTVIEGTYAMHPYFGKYYDFAICALVTPELQLERIQERDPDLFDIYENIWIPLEQIYLHEYQIPQNANLVLKDTGEPSRFNELGEVQPGFS